MAQKKKNTTGTSPAGRALYPKLKDPDTKFKEAGEYSVKLLLTEAEAAPLLKLCQDLQQRAAEEEVEKQQVAKPKMKPEKIREGIKLADLPVKPYEDPETGEDTGEYQVTFKMTASGVSKKTGKPWTRKPALFDARNQPIDPASVDIGSGSILKVAFEASPFCTAIGAGVSMRLEAVQVIELVTFGQKDAKGYGFGEEDGGYSHDASSSGSPFKGNDPFGGSGGGSGNNGDDTDSNNDTEGESDF